MLRARAASAQHHCSCLRLWACVSTCRPSPLCPKTCRAVFLDILDFCARVLPLDRPLLPDGELAALIRAAADQVADRANSTDLELACSVRAPDGLARRRRRQRSGAKKQQKWRLVKKETQRAPPNELRQPHRHSAGRALGAKVFVVFRTALRDQSRRVGPHLPRAWWREKTWAGVERGRRAGEGRRRWPPRGWASASASSRILALSRR
jgi:hypothetical protein